MTAMVGPVGADTQAAKELISTAERIKRFITNPFLLLSVISLKQINQLLGVLDFTAPDGGIAGWACQPEEHS
jgi:hypothetical protein